MGRGGHLFSIKPIHCLSRFKSSGPVIFVLQLYVSVCMIYTPNIESFETLQDRFSILKNPKVE